MTLASLVQGNEHEFTLNQIDKNKNTNRNFRTSGKLLLSKYFFTFVVSKNLKILH